LIAGLANRVIKKSNDYDINNDKNPIIGEYVDNLPYINNTIHTEENITTQQYDDSNEINYTD